MILNTLLKCALALALGLLIGEAIFAMPAPKMRVLIYDPWEQTENRDHLSCFLLFSSVVTDPESMSELEKENILGRSPEDLRTLEKKLGPAIRRRWDRLARMYGLGREDLQKALDRSSDRLELFYTGNQNSWIPYLLSRWEYCETEYAEEVIK